MENQPLVSIALCTYNGQAHIEAQLDTLVNQTYTHTEIIVVDDCSKDSTVKIVQEYMKDHPQIKLHINSRNLGYQKNFEKAFSLCSGKYILPSDQDDIWSLEKIETLLDNVEDHLLIYHDSEFVSAKGEPIGKKMSDLLNMVEGSDPIPFLFYNCISGHSMMFSRKLLHQVLPLPNEGVYDHYIAFMAASIGTIKYLNETLAKHRQHEENATDILGRKKTKSRLKVTLERMDRENLWLKICADKGMHKASELAKDLYEAGKQRNRNFINLKFAYLVFKHQKRLTHIPKNKSFKTLGFALRQTWGAKAKSLWKRN